MKNLEKRRLEAGLSRERLGWKAGVSQNTIEAIERKGTRPRVDIAAKLAKALGTTIDDLMGKSKRAS
jgi:DNA-binding XRE family transcriptional regulator